MDRAWSTRGRIDGAARKPSEHGARLGGQRRGAALQAKPPMRPPLPRFAPRRLDCRAPARFGNGLGTGTALMYAKSEFAYIDTCKMAVCIHRRFRHSSSHFEKHYEGSGGAT